MQTATGVTATTGKMLQGNAWWGSEASGAGSDERCGLDAHQFSTSCPPAAVRPLPAPALQSLGREPRVPDEEAQHDCYGRVHGHLLGALQLERSVSDSDQSAPGTWLGCVCGVGWLGGWVAGWGMQWSYAPARLQRGARTLNDAHVHAHSSWRPSQAVWCPQLCPCPPCSYSHAINPPSSNCRDDWSSNDIETCDRA